MKVKGKFVCHSIQAQKDRDLVTMMAVPDDNENKSFSKLAASSTLVMFVDNDTTDSGVFELDQEYYLELTKV